MWQIPCAKISILGQVQWIQRYYKYFFSLVHIVPILDLLQAALPAVHFLIHNPEPNQSLAIPDTLLCLSVGVLVIFTFPHWHGTVQ